MPSISETRFYCLTLSGAPDTDFLASFCPQGTQLVFVNNDALLENIRTDQSGIIGIIRHLHNLGCVILELTIEKERK